MPWKPNSRRPASEVPLLTSAGELDLEDEYLQDSGADKWRPVWQFPGVLCPPHWHELLRHRRIEMQDRKERVRQRVWTRQQYLQWRSEQLMPFAGSGTPTQTDYVAGSNCADEGAWADEPIPQHVRQQWECVRQIGHGGFGSVYLVRRRDTGAERALKVTKPGVDERAIINEIKSLERVRSPHVVQVREYQSTRDGQWLIFTEHVRGMSLQAYLHAQEEQRVADPHLVRMLLLGIAGGLADLHRKGLIHGDLKPANIVLREDQDGLTPVIIELGMASGAQRPGMTVQGGTPRYQSPEQQDGQPCTPASDVFAFGVIAYEAVTGHRMAGGALSRLRAACPALPEGLDELVKEECANALVAERITDGMQLLGRIEALFGSEWELRAKSIADQASLVTSCRRAAESGDSSAMTKLAECLESGSDGVAPDPQAAVPWYHRAADAGNLEAMCHLARCLGAGIGVAEDVPAAVQWLRRASEAGSAEAMWQLGLILLHGHDGSKDPSAGLRWLQRSADAGHLEAMTTVGNCHAHGEGTARNPAAAVEWYRRAAEGGDPGAMYALSDCLRYGRGIETNEAAANAWHRLARDTARDWGAAGCTRTPTCENPD